MANHYGVPKISIIVRVFNAEQFLSKCVESLFAQTIANELEYIFIDDASQDRSLELLQQHISSRSDLNVTLIHNQNNIGSTCFLNGLDVAKGEFFQLCDSDDWIEADMAESLYNAATNNNADIATSPFYINQGNSQSIIHFPNPNLVGDINKVPNDVLHFSLCNKIIRRSIITDNDIYCTEGVDCWEDLAISARAIALANKVIAVDKPFYHYRKTGHSITASRHKRILNDHLHYANLLDTWFADRGETFYQKHAEFLGRLKFIAKIKMLRGETIEITRWKNTYSDTNKHIATNAMQFGLFYKIAFFALHLCPAKLAITIARCLGKNAE